ncbi:hypothetical protein F5887DRAFT_49123 [Amanita rubescens]|nr:hypothetical protein F5887DRAFT_49123 [Amanita rubescens]
MLYFGSTPAPWVVIWHCMAFSASSHFAISGSEITNISGNYYTINTGIGDALEDFHRFLSFVNCDAKHRKVRSAIRMGTLAGEWLLRHEAYTMWKEETSLTRLLWIKGVPGAGKSVLSSVIIDDLRKIQNPRLAVAFFYCELQDPLKRDPTNVLSNLLAQLLRKVSRGKPAVTNLLKQCPNPQSVHDFDLTELILEFAREFDKTFVVIDAVDECDNLAELLPALTTLAVEINVLATGRDNSQIRNEFQGHGKVIIGRDDINHDVRRFVETDVRHVKTRDPQLLQDIIDRLISGAQGT